MSEESGKIGTPVKDPTRAWLKMIAKQQKPISGQLASASGAARAGMSFAVRAASGFDCAAEAFSRVPSLIGREELDYIKDDLRNASECLATLYTAMDAIDKARGKAKEN